MANSSRPTWRRLALLGPVLACLWAFQASAAGVEASEAEIKQLRGRIDSIRKSIQADAERRDALTGQLKNADLEIQSAR